MVAVVQTPSSLASTALYYGNFIQAPDVDIRNPFSIRIEISSDLFCGEGKERNEKKKGGATTSVDITASGPTSVTHDNADHHDQEAAIVAERQARVSAFESTGNVDVESIFELSRPLIRQWTRSNIEPTNTETSTGTIAVEIFHLKGFLIFQPSNIHAMRLRIYNFHPVEMEGILI